MPNEQKLEQYYHHESYFEGAVSGGYENYDQQTKQVLPLFAKVLTRIEKRLAPSRSILDVGCAYGTHLATAAQRGWACYGVEVSDHARAIAKRRHGHSMYIVGQIDQLPPAARFDVILLLDVLEHLKDPYALFTSLLKIGAIGDETTIVVTTPNARSADAVGNPRSWAYRHPPSHLVYYSAESLRILFSRLGFADVQTIGIYESVNEAAHYYDDEPFKTNRRWVSHAGLLCHIRRKKPLLQLWTSVLKASSWFKFLPIL
jgi:SAM-dependent methyltransferase